MNGYTVGGTIRATYALASELAKRHDVEIVSVYRRRTKPLLALDPAVRLRALTDLRTATRKEVEAASTPRERLRKAWETRALARPSVLIDPADARHDNFSGLTDANLLRFLLQTRDGVLIGTRPGLNLAIARYASRSVLRIGQDHLNLRSYSDALRAAIAAHYPDLHLLSTLTADDARDYRALLGRRTRVVTVPNGVPPLHGHRSTLDAKVVVAAGRLVAQKGFDRLLPVWKLVSDRHPDWQLRIYGRGGDQEKLQAQIDELGIGDRAKLMGYSSKLAENLAAASLYVMTSRTEGFPMVLLEAMGVGLPVVSYDCPTGPRDLISSGVDGYVVANGDKFALESALLELIEDADKRRAFGAAALEKAAQYDAPAIAARWEELIEEVGATRGDARADLKHALNHAARRLGGYEIRRVASLPQRPLPSPNGSLARLPAHYDTEARRTILGVQPRTSSSTEALDGLIVATRHIVDSGLPGAFVECGVWRGGAMQAVARTLVGRGALDRDLHLFDTFAGMPEPGERDRRQDGTPAAELLEAQPRTSRVWGVAELDDVRAGMDETTYPRERVHLHRGPVEETLPGEAPERIALLRLDLSWYDGTRHALEALHDRLVEGGVLVLGGYDVWEGARDAVDEFFAARGRRPLLVPVGSGRMAIKSAD